MTGAVFALILSVIAPGSGQIYNGQYLKGAVFASLFIFGRYVILPLLIRIIKFKDQIKLLKFIYFFNTVYPAVIILAAFDAALVGYKASHTSMALLFSSVIAIIFISASRGMKNPFIVFAMSGREDIVKYIIVPKKK